MGDRGNRDMKWWKVRGRRGNKSKGEGKKERGKVESKEIEREGMESKRNSTGWLPSYSLDYNSAVQKQ